MKLNEVQAKLRLAEFGIPIPQGQAADTPQQAKIIAEELAKPVFVKAQIPLSGRIHMDGVKYAPDPLTAFKLAEAMLNTTFNGLIPRAVLVEQAIETVHELYIGITYDRTTGQPMLIVSSEGGAELEQISQSHPEITFRETIDPLIGLRGYQIITIASKLNLPRSIWSQLQQIVLALYDCFVDTDSQLIEVNPLALTHDNQLLALDAKMIIDENALFRQTAIKEQYISTSQSHAEQQARAAALSYVKLNGQIGCVFNGAGIAMAMMDLIYMYGGDQVKPANFLDVGGSAKIENWKTGLRIVLQDDDVRCVLMNVFGGTIRCDDAARALIDLCIEESNEKPIVVRLRGTNATQGTRIIGDAQLPYIHFAGTLTDAVTAAIRLAVEST